MLGVVSLPAFPILAHEDGKLDSLPVKKLDDTLQTNAIVILGLTIPPCMAFLFFAIDRKNYLSIIPISIFTVCHFIYGFVNYIF